MSADYLTILLFMRQLKLTVYILMNTIMLISSLRGLIINAYEEVREVYARSRTEVGSV